MATSTNKDPKATTVHKVDDLLYRLHRLRGFLVVRLVHRLRGFLVVRLGSQIVHSSVCHLDTF